MASRTRQGPHEGRHTGGKGARRALLAALLVAVGSLVACNTTPIRAFQGAREYAVGTEALDRGEAALAVESLERAATLVPEASEVQNHLGLAYWQSGDPSRARAAFERALVLDCDNAAARTNLARLDASTSRGLESLEGSEPDERGRP